MLACVCPVSLIWWWEPYGRNRIFTYGVQSRGWNPQTMSSFSNWWMRRKGILFIIGVTILLFFWPIGASSNLYHTSSMSGMMTSVLPAEWTVWGTPVMLHPYLKMDSVSYESGFGSFSIRNQGYNRPGPHDVIREGADPNLQTRKVASLPLGWSLWI